MIIVMRPGVTDAQLDHVRERVEAAGMRTHVSRGEQRVIVGCIGDDALLEDVPLLSLAGVESVTPVLKPYRLAAREFTAARTAVRIGDAADTVVGGRELTVMAGPCAVEGESMLLETAHRVQAAGARVLRGGAFKPRTSPYSFRGLGERGLELLAAVRGATGLPVVTEVMDTRQVDLVAGYADVLQVGARNMQNFPLLSELGRLQRPVLLKRGLSATVRELLMAAEYVMEQGNRDVILCERGIRTFETSTRNTLDIGAIPVLKAETHLPVIVDPSHAAGRSPLVAPLAFAAVAAGADGLLMEVHPHPEDALSDGAQSLDPDAFDALMNRLAAFAAAAGRSLVGRSPEGVQHHAAA